MNLDPTTRRRQSASPSAAAVREARREETAPRCSYEPPVTARPTTKAQFDKPPARTVLLRVLRETVSPPSPICSTMPHGGAEP